jgi:uncharacterized protein YecE (DUF72 family)
MKMGKIILGTSGWSYPEWVGVFYPSSKDSKLGYYARIFSTAEIDSTFYAFPTEGMVLGWQRYSPKDFVFNAKLPQSITHEKLKDLGSPIERDLDRFTDLMQPLNTTGKLGCLLIQLPPKYKYDLNHLESFLSLLPKGYRYAIEFRNKSWMRSDTWQTLSRYNIAYTIVDEPLLPPEIHTTADFAYLRWHGRSQRPWYDYEYNRNELEEWVPKVRGLEAVVKTTYGYFNNHFHGYAVENALEILSMLGKLTPAQEEALERAKKHLHQDNEQIVNLGEWTRGGDKRLLLVETLTGLMGEARLARAYTIPDNEVHVELATKTRIVAKVRDYNVLMDDRTRTITHDCADFSKSITSPRLCKHIGKLLLTIPEDTGYDWAMSLQSDLGKWRFTLPSE